jgi:hypothetical protein
MKTSACIVDYVLKGALLLLGTCPKGIVKIHHADTQDQNYASEAAE